jgi:hypothetical protein
MQGVTHPRSIVDVDALQELVRALVRDEVARPLLVNQRTVASIVGLDAREYLRLARAGAFPSTRERRLIVARTSDVVCVFESRMRTLAANDSGAEASTFARSRSGLRRVSA